MPPIIHLIRHAEAQHQPHTGREPGEGVRSNHNMPDPNLTDRGREQCRELALASRANGLWLYVTHVVASPSLRATRTATATFKSALRFAPRPLDPVILNADFMETGDSPCNRPSTVADIKARHGRRVDTSILETQPGYVARALPGGPYGNTGAAIRERARRARIWLRQLARACGAEDDAEIVVVSHGAFLRDLVQSGDEGPWENAEMRSYVFENWGEDGDEEAKLTPVGISQVFRWRNRGLMEAANQSQDPPTLPLI